MQNSAGATWTAELMFFGCTPFDLRVTDTTGQTVLLRYWNTHFVVGLVLHSMPVALFAVVAVNVCLYSLVAEAKHDVLQGGHSFSRLYWPCTDWHAVCPHTQQNYAGSVTAIYSSHRKKKPYVTTCPKQFLGTRAWKWCTTAVIKAAW